MSQAPRHSKRADVEVGVVAAALVEGLEAARRRRTASTRCSCTRRRRAAPDGLRVEHVVEGRDGGQVGRASGASRTPPARCPPACTSRSARWTACSAGIAAERRSGYFAMCASISARSSSGTGVVAGSGTPAGSFVEVGGVVPAGDARAVPEARHACRVDRHQRSIPPRIGSSIAERRDQVGDVGVLDHRRGGLEVHEARVAHVHARGLARAVGAHEAAELAARRPRSGSRPRPAGRGSPR